MLAVRRWPGSGKVLSDATWRSTWRAPLDVMIVRIAFVVLTIFSGAGIPLYLAGLFLIPEEGSNQSIASSLIESLRSRSR